MQNAYTTPPGSGPGYHDNRGRVGAEIPSTGNRNIAPTPLSGEAMRLPNVEAEITVFGLAEAGFMGDNPFAPVNVNTLEIMVESLKAIFNRAFGLSNTYFENVDNIKRMLKYQGAKAIAYPRTSLSLTTFGGTTDLQAGGVAMRNGGVLTAVRGRAQPTRDRVRFVPVTLAFQVTTFYLDYNYATQLAQSVVFAAGLRSLSFEVKAANGMTNRVYVDIDPTVTLNPVQFENEEESGAGTVEFSVTLETILMNIDEGIPLSKTSVGLNEDFDPDAELAPHIDTTPELSREQQIINAMLGADSGVVAAPGRVIPTRP